MNGVAILIRGPAGSGKSDVALRMIDSGALLVADDQTRLEVAQGRLVASSPAVIEGLLEVRGVGVVPVPSTPRATLALVVDLVPEDEVERMPEKHYCEFLGVKVRRLKLPAFAASTPAKLRLALSALGLDGGA